MDITNSTDMDTKYKVTGSGGPPMGGQDHHRDFPSEEAVSWPTLHAGRQISLHPNSSGPWTVYFYVQGKGFIATAETSDVQVTLMRSGAGFHVQAS
jgi:hypothetical protein